MTAEPDRRRLAGRYRVDGSLGRGGMSEVFHGYDECLDRQVAIKLLRPPTGPVPAGPDSPEAVEILDALDRDRKRFLREIRTTARLELAGAPAVYDTGVEVGPDGSDRLWVVMQLLHGSTLESVLDRTDAAALLLADRPAEAVRLLQDGVGRAGHDPAMGLRLRQLLASALYDAGEVSRAAPLFAAAGRDYGRHLAPTDPLAVECSTYAGLSYAQLGDSAKALPHLLFVVQNAADPTAIDLLDVRFALAHMLAAAGRRDEALAELTAIRPSLVEALGAGSTHVQNLDKHLRRLATEAGGPDQRLR